jgi:hypothetical protein
LRVLINHVLLSERHAVAHTCKKNDEEDRCSYSIEIVDALYIKKQKEG